MQPATTRDAQELCAAAKVDHTVPTNEAAVLLGVAPQTLRRWSCEGSGPIRPRHVNGRLRWVVSEIRSVLAGAASAA
jgi:hypothetical protein